MSMLVSSEQCVIPPEAVSLQGLGALELRHNSDGSRYYAMRVYNATGGVLNVGQPYILYGNTGGDEEFTPAVLAVAGLAAVPRRVCIALEAAAIGGYTWVAVQGWVDNVLLTGTITKGDGVKLATGTSTTRLTTDGTTQTTATLGTAAQAGSSTHVGTVWLSGELAVVTT
ncbi:MAG: hypothetical protein ACREJW_00765 [Candidatus Methylomirabilales bacterium]